MKFIPTSLAGACVLELERHEDSRGFFARAWCEEEFAAHGIDMRVVQCNISLNRQRGTLRGMHYQVAPHAEKKVVRCTRGAIYDVIIDLRPDSATFKQWFATELTAENYRMLYIPDGFAHGLQTLEDNSEVFYLMSEFFHPESARGVRWNDPAFGVVWPECEARVMSKQDRAYEDFA
jgi:dTDP-4-dehydrorhamnose 3,5-epimerase